jgi:subtilisin family serine protease
MRHFKKSTTLFLTALLLFAAGLWAPARGAGLTETGADDPRPYIVVFEQRPVRGLRSLAADPAAQIKDRLQEQTRTTFNLIVGALVDMTPAEAESLAAEPGVAFIEPDYPVYALSQTVPWGVERIYEEETYPFEAWQTTSGAGIGVAILDTGIQGNHEDLPALVGGTSTVDSSNYYEDGNGHGTHVAGIFGEGTGQRRARNDFQHPGRHPVGLRRGKRYRYYFHEPGHHGIQPSAERCLRCSLCDRSSSVRRSGKQWRPGG